VADEQTAGRGRGAHEWRSDAGAGLYVSVLLRPAIAPADALWLSLAAGLAVQAAVREVTALEPDIRWPNDLLLSGKKFCGILTELNAEATRVRHAVVGIGINVHQPAFPPELAPIATSLAMETGRNWPRQELLVSLLKALHRETAALTRPGAMDRISADILARLSTASSWVKGKRVTIDEAESWSGITDGLDARGFLRVRTPNGLRTVLSGGVRELPLSQVR
jgi:BirA family biotin operon repressor/biotin-[acetyl-CoA-carboxylase] ligase